MGYGYKRRKKHAMKKTSTIDILKSKPRYGVVSGLLDEIFYYDNQRDLFDPLQELVFFKCPEEVINTLVDTSVRNPNFLKVHDPPLKDQ